MTLKLVTPPADEPITLQDAKRHLRAVDDDEDDLIAIFLKAARQHAEKFTGRAFIDQTWDYYLDEFPDDDDAIEIPLSPLIAVEGVFYTDDAVAEQEFDAASYIVTGEGDRSNKRAKISLTTSGSWPTPRDAGNSVRIRFRAGYLNTDSPPAADVDSDIIAAILMHLGSLYENRQTVVIGQAASMLPWGAEALLRMKRVDLSMA